MGQKGISSHDDVYGGSDDQDERADDNHNGVRNDSTGDYAGSSESVEEDNLVDSEGEEQLDDDLMDKISSSPSIDDGELVSLLFVVHPPKDSTESR